MNAKRVRSNHLLLPLLLWLLWLLWPAVGVAGAERFDYRVVYQGVLSLGGEIPIADVVLESHAPGGERHFSKTELSASSEAYPLVESLYPMRYRFRSWGAGADGSLMGFEAYEQTKRLRHHLYLRDDSALGVTPLDLASGGGGDVVERLDAGAIPAVQVLGELFDRLGLLQRVRRQPLAAGETYSFPVTNGREAMIYRVRVETAQTLDIAGQATASWKVRFDGYDLGDDGSETPAHRPLFIWLAQAPGHAPLRADARHAVGLFRLELVAPAAAGALARTAQR